MSSPGLLYKLAKIYDADGDISQPWFVFFYHRSSVTEKFKRERVYANLATFKDKKSRRQMAELLQDTINECLKNGDLNALPEAEQDPAKDMQYHNIITALRTVQEQMIAGKRKRSKQTYDSALKLFESWCKEKGIDSLPVTYIRSMHLADYQASLIKKGLNGKTINARVGNVGRLFTKLYKMEVIQKDPFQGIDAVPETEDTGVFEPYTNEELERIARRLQKDAPELFLIWLLIYYAFLRPATIVQLRRKDFDFEKQTIFIPAATHKNKKDATKQMLRPLHNYLIAAGIDKLPGNSYLFSTNLKPGYSEIQPVRASELWKEIIIDDEDIPKKLYAAKHTGGIDYLELNPGQENLNWLQQQMAHHSIAQTDAYIKGRKVTMVDEQKTNFRKI